MNTTEDVIEQIVRNLDARISNLANSEKKSWWVGITPKDDNATDQSDALNAAILLASVGGGTVVVGPGTILAHTIVLQSKVHMRGAGIEATILKVPNGVNADLFVGANFASLTGTNSSAGIHSWSVTHMTLDGNKANNATSGWCLRVYGYGYHLDNVRLRNGRSGGIYSEWGDAGEASGPDSMEAHLNGFMVHDCAGPGIKWAGPHDSVWVNGHVFKNGAEGVWVLPNGGALQATHVHVWGLSHTYAWRCDERVLLTNCSGEGASVAQAQLAFNDCQIWGGQWVGFTGVSPAVVGIEIGKAGVPVAGMMVNTHILNCASAFAFTNDGGGSDIRALVYQTTGAAVAGTPSGSTRLEVYSPAGASGSITVIPAGSLYLSAGGADMAGRLLVRGAGLTNAVTVFSGTQDLLNVDVPNKLFALVNGTNLQVFSGNYATLVAEIGAAAAELALLNGAKQRFYSGNYTGLGIEINSPAGAIAMTEISDPAAPAANTAFLFVRDNGSGKTQFCARFPSGAVQVIATEP